MLDNIFFFFPSHNQPLMLAYFFPQTRFHAAGVLRNNVDVPFSRALSFGERVNCAHMFV